MTKRSGISQTNADPRLNKPLIDIDLTATVELIADLTAYQNQFRGWFIRFSNVLYGTGGATNTTYGLFFATSLTNIYAATQDVGVFGRVNTSTGATGITNGSGTGPINVAGVGANFVTTSTVAAPMNGDLFMNNGPIPSGYWQSIYSTTGGTMGSANGGFRFFATAQLTHVRFGSNNVATGPGQQFTSGRMQIFGIP